MAQPYPYAPQAVPMVPQLVPQMAGQMVVPAVPFVQLNTAPNVFSVRNVPQHEKLLGVHSKANFQVMRDALDANTAHVLLTAPVAEPTRVQLSYNGSVIQHGDFMTAPHAGTRALSYGGAAIQPGRMKENVSSRYQNDSDGGKKLAKTKGELQAALDGIKAMEDTLQDRIAKLTSDKENREAADADIIEKKDKLMAKIQVLQKIINEHKVELVTIKAKYENVGAEFAREQGEHAASLDELESALQKHKKFSQEIDELQKELASTKAQKSADERQGERLKKEIQVIERAEAALRAGMAKAENEAAAVNYAVQKQIPPEVNEHDNATMSGQGDDGNRNGSGSQNDKVNEEAEKPVRSNEVAQEEDGNLFTIYY